MNNIELLKRVAYTLDRIKTDNVDSNWDRLIGCKQAIAQVIQSLENEGDDTDAVHEESME